MSNSIHTCILHTALSVFKYVLIILSKCCIRVAHATFLSLSFFLSFSSNRDVNMTMTCCEWLIQTKWIYMNYFLLLLPYSPLLLFCHLNLKHFQQTIISSFRTTYSFTLSLLIVIFISSWEHARCIIFTIYNSYHILPS